MRRGIIPAILIFLLLQLQAYADIYQYEDTDGTVIMTDKPENVPKDRRNNSRKTTDSSAVTVVDPPKNAVKQKIKAAPEHDSCSRQLNDTVQFCRKILQTGVRERPDGISENEYIVFMYELCGNPLLENMLTGAELFQVGDLGYKSKALEKQIPPKKLYEVKAFSRMLNAACNRNVEEKIYSRYDLDDVGKQLTQIWREMSSALAAHNVRKAARYFHETVQDDWQRQYASMPAKVLKQMAQEMLDSELHVDRVEGDARAVCELLTTREGTQYSFQLIFIKGFDNEWKIYSF